MNLHEFTSQFEQALTRKRHEALTALLRAARSSAIEGAALDLMRARRSELSPELQLEICHALWDRGALDSAEALASELARDVGSAEAHFVAAELRSARGDARTALQHLEEVLRRDLDYPGARARRTRLLDILGRAPQKEQSANATEARPAPDTPFRILREVGRGGAGRVYEAEDAALQRKVALKIYHRPLEEAVQLQNEAAVATALEGEGVIRVFQVSHAWIALEWAALGPLRDRPRSGSWVTSVARSLARIHQARFVHNDIKPGNIVLHREDRAVLTDFGIARPEGEPAPLGSLGYMSPARADRSPSTPREDIYGFGRTLQECAPDGFQGLARQCLSEDAPRNGQALLQRVLELIRGV